MEGTTSVRYNAASNSTPPFLDRSNMRYFIMSLEILSSEGIPWSPIFFALSIIDETSLIMLSLLLSCAVLPDPLFEPLSDPLPEPLPDPSFEPLPVPLPDPLLEPSL